MIYFSELYSNISSLSSSMQSAINSLYKFEFGTISSVSVSANSYKDVTVSFSNSWTYTPTLFYSIMTSSTSTAYGGIQATTTSASTSSFTCRVFNQDTSSSREPNVKWLAIGNYSVSVTTLGDPDDDGTGTLEPEPGIVIPDDPDSGGNDNPDDNGDGNDDNTGTIEPEPGIVIPDDDNPDDTPTDDSGYDSGDDSGDDDSSNNDNSEINPDDSSNDDPDD